VGYELSFTVLRSSAFTVRWRSWRWASCGTAMKVALS